MDGLDLKNVPIDLLLNILNIIILFVIVRFLVYKPVKKFMDARTARIISEREAAAEERAQAEQTKKQNEAAAAESQAKAREILETAEAEAQKNADKLLADAQNECAGLKAEAHGKLEQERKEMLASVRKDTAKLAIDISEKVLGRAITDEDNRKLAEEYFEGIADDSKA